jgi:hypothetical protein
MPGVDLFRVYRRFFGTPQDGEVAWWYLGTTMVDVVPFTLLPIIQAETLMVYRTETVDRDTYKIHWREVGYFRDPASGKVADQWVNPITGATIIPPRMFEEGPACFTVTRTGEGVAISLVQANASAPRVELTGGTHNGRVFLKQIERKVRGFPNPDGSLPPPGSDRTTEAVSTLTPYADIAAVDADHEDWRGFQGAYSFELPLLPPWMGFGDRTGRTLVRGLMQKARIDERFNPVAWDRLAEVFPHYFSTGAIRFKW